MSERLGEDDINQIWQKLKRSRPDWTLEKEERIRQQRGSGQIDFMAGGTTRLHELNQRHQKI